jgi:hypothetical protein
LAAVRIRHADDGPLATAAEAHAWQEIAQICRRHSLPGTSLRVSDPNHVGRDGQHTTRRAPFWVITLVRLVRAVREIDFHGQKHCPDGTECEQNQRRICRQGRSPQSTARRSFLSDTCGGGLAPRICIVESRKSPHCVSQRRLFVMMAGRKTDRDDIIYLLTGFRPRGLKDFCGVLRAVWRSPCN